MLVHNAIIMSEKKITVKKRKKVVIYVDEKYAVIRKLDQGEAAVVMAADLGVGKSTIINRKKIEQKFRDVIQLM